MLAGSVLKNKCLSILAGAVCLYLLFSCGGTNPDPDPGSGKGKVALFITDNISFYKQVVATVTSVRLIDSGLRTSCDVLGDPVTLDIANLTDMAHYVHLAECAAGRYNVLEIDIRKDVRLMDQLDTPSACSLDFLWAPNGSMAPLDCDSATGLCTVRIRGGVRDQWVTVLEDRYNDLGIDFNLKKFTVTDFGDPAACSVTMAAATISASDFNESGRAHSVTAPIAGLDTVTETFTLLASGGSLTVDYSGILPALQPNIDILLAKAQSEGLKVNVLTDGIDIANAFLSATRIYMKAAGAVTSVVDMPTWTFTLTFAPLQTIAGSHRPPAEVQGNFADGAWADVKFEGYHAGRDEYLASAVEVLPSGTALDD